MPQAACTSGDASTVDFAYLPKLFEEQLGFVPAAIRVPILPHIDSDSAEAVLEQYPELEAAAGGYQDTAGEASLMKAEISEISAGSQRSWVVQASSSTHGLLTLESAAAHIASIISG